VGLRARGGAGRLGEGLWAAGWSGDRVIEAIEARGRRFVLGVQWHPEDTLDWDPKRRLQGPGAPAWNDSQHAKHLRLFEALVAAAAQARTSSSACD